MIAAEIEGRGVRPNPATTRKYDLYLQPNNRFLAQAEKFSIEWCVFVLYVN
jgi:hypothetical protein